MKPITATEFTWYPKRQEIMTLMALQKNQNAVRQMIKTETERLNRRTQPADVATPHIPEPSPSEAPCFACAEMIPAAAHVCRHCQTIQPSSIETIVALQLFLTGKISEPKVLQEIVAFQDYAKKGGGM